MVQELLQNNHSILRRPRPSTFLGRHNFYSNVFWPANIHMELLCHYGLTFSLVVLYVISKHFNNSSNTLVVDD